MNLEVDLGYQPDSARVAREVCLRVQESGRRRVEVRVPGGIRGVAEGGNIIDQTGNELWVVEDV